MIRLDLLYLNEVTGRLEQFSKNLSDFGELWDDISQIMVDHTEETWATDGFSSWPPLSDNWRKYKERHGYPPDLMVMEGNLLDSLTDPERAAGIGQGRSTLGTFTGKAFSWGTDVEYAGYHHEGPDHNPALPVRNVIIVTPGLLQKVEEAAEDHVERAAREAGVDG